MKRLLFPLILLALVAGCANQDVPAPVASPEAATSLEVIKSPNDDRAYRYLELDNSLPVILISDAETDKSAAALVVFRGSMHDPEAHPGLAHFLEHMLFIGTEKYPEVDGYQNYIAAGGGSSNAYTAGDHTNYFFDIAPERFPEALDRFAQFFISPLFSAEYVEREKNAVNSEYQLQIKDDGWRGNAVDKVAMNPAHPASRFNIGSLETLGEGVRPALLDFFEKSYSADQMALVVLDKQPLPDIEKLVRDRFSGIENREIGEAAPLGDAYTEAQLPARLDYLPIKEERSVTYRFPTESTLPLYRSKPEIYLTNLLGHEGKGSLLQALKAKGWVNALYAGGGNLDDDESVIEVSMNLTEQGAAHIPEISGYLFAYVDLLRTNAPERWRFDEQARVADLGFRFLEKRGAMATVYQMAPSMMHLPPEDVLRARFLMQDFDAPAIKRFADRLTPDNVLLSVQLPSASTDSEETWFNVPYSLQRAPLEIVSPEVDDLAMLHLPEPNPYLPEDLTLLESTAEPLQVMDQPSATIWQHTDTTFGAPKAMMRFNLNVAGGLVTPEDIAAARLYRRLVDDALNEFAYPTYLAGISYGITPLPAGFRFEVSGYNDKQLTLLDRVLETFAGLDIAADRFEIIKAELSEDLDNARNERPFNQAYDALGDALRESRWPAPAVAAALNGLTPERLEAWRDEHLESTRLFALLHGNLPASQPQVLKELISKHIDLSGEPTVIHDVVQLKDAATIQLDVDHNDAAFVAYVQDADDSWASRAKSALAVQLLRQSYFTSLRTEQQLGYVVAMANRTMRTQGGVAFIVQSPVAGPDVIMQSTRSFLAEQIEALRNMPADAFEASRQGLLVLLRKADENLLMRTNRYWSDLVDDITTLDSRERIAQQVEQLTQEEMVAFVDDLVRRLDEESLAIVSQGRFETQFEHGTAYDGVVPFKQRGS